MFQDHSGPLENHTKPFAYIDIEATPNSFVLGFQPPDNIHQLSTNDR